MNHFLLIILSSLFIISRNQSSLVWSNSDYVQVQSITITITPSSNKANETSSITFSKQFLEIPTILFSLKRLQSLTNNSFIFQESTIITKVSFTHKVITNNHENNIKKLTLMYIALDLNAINFVFPHVMKIPITHLSISNNPNVEYTEVEYLNPLMASNTYELAVFLTGLNVIPDGLCQIGVQAELYTLISYLLKTTAQNCFFVQVQFTRILVDRTAQAASILDINKLNVQIGFVEHRESEESLFLPRRTTFYPQTFFYGIYQFRTKFNLINQQSIFDPPANNSPMKIFYFFIKQKKCPVSQPLYNSQHKTCHSECEIQLYQVSLEQCLPCHNSCYKCDGPLQTNCTDCLQGYGRTLDQATSRCQCLLNFFQDSVTGHCQLCSFFVAGCQVCRDLTYCDQCYSGCVEISGTCTCPQLCDTGLFQYLSPHTGECLCLPQFFRNADGDCQPCAKGCFICEVSRDNCSQCIDRYYLVGTSCLYFTVSEAYFIKSPGFIREDQRCLSKMGDQCINQCPITSKMFNDKCYETNCPPQTFAIITNQGNKLCHSCKAPCIQCSLYYICNRCQPTFYFTGDTGLCQSCLKNCYSCSDSISCDQCLNGYRFNVATNQCEEDLPIFRQDCSLGCLECVIYEFCQICSNGYFLYHQQKSCISCQNNEAAGLSLQQYSVTESGVTIQECKQICGDGIIYNHQCDDKNQVSGDGCSQNCTIQEDYRCEYFTSQQQSVCFKAGFKLNFSMEKNLTNNQIYITVIGKGINVVTVPYKIACEGQYKYIGETTTIKNNQEVKIFTLEMLISMQNSQCSFYLEDSANIPNVTYAIMTQPQALFIENSENSGQHPTLILMKETIFYQMYKPCAIFIWIVCLLSIDPFEIWATLYFIVLCLTTMYDYLHSIPNIYHLFQGLKYFIFNYNSLNHVEDNVQNLVGSSYKILIFFGGLILYNEVLVRILKNETIFGANQIAIFRNIFSHRLSAYYCIFTAFQPIALFYCFKILQQLTSGSIQVEDLTSLNLQQIIAIIVVAVYGLCYIISGIFMVVQIRSVLLENNQQNAKQYQNKYLFFISTCKILNLTILMSLIFNSTEQIVISWGGLLTMLLWLILLLLDTYPQVLKSTHVKTKRKTKRKTSRTTQQEDDQDQCCTARLNRHYLRKFSLLIRIISFIIVCLCRILYFADFNLGFTGEQSSTINSSGDYYLAEYLLLGDIVSITIIIGFIALPIIFTIIIQGVVLYHYVQTDADDISNELLDKQEKKEAEEQKREIKAALGKVDQSNNHLYIPEESVSESSQLKR